MSVLIQKKDEKQHILGTDYQICERTGGKAVKKFQWRDNCLQKCHLLYPTHSSAIAPVPINMRGAETKMFVLNKRIQNASFQMYEDCSVYYMYFIATKWNQTCYEHLAEIWETRQERPLILTTGRGFFYFFLFLFFWSPVLILIMENGWLLRLWVGFLNIFFPRGDRQVLNK